MYLLVSVSMVYSFEPSMVEFGKRPLGEFYYCLLLVIPSAAPIAQE